MSTDTTLQCVLPALSLNYSVHPDSDGRLMFKNSYCTIRYVKDCWKLTDLNSDVFFYHDLKAALLGGC